MKIMNTCIGIAAAGFFAHAAWVWAEPRESRSISVSSPTIEIPIFGEKPVLLSLASWEGDIEVTCEERSVAVITIEDYEPNDRDLNQASIDYNQAESTIKITLRGELKESDIELCLPCSFHLDISSNDGDIRIRDIQGEINAKTIDGNLELENVYGPISAETYDGNIEVSVRSQQNLQPISLATIDGNIDVALPSQADFYLYAATLDGNFECAFDLSSARFIQKGDATRIKASINEGGPRISLKTVDGNVSIKRSKSIENPNK